MDKELLYSDPHGMSSQDVESAALYDCFNFPEETTAIIKKENLLPTGLLKRLHASYPQYSGIKASNGFLFTGKERYEGLNGFREIVGILQQNSIQIGFLQERELFIKVYRFLATKHVLNSINWNDFREDSLFQLVFPQPGMISAEIVQDYLQAKSEDERETLIAGYIKKTNPHDGKQKLNKPWFINEETGIEVVDGSQHKYPQCQLIFDKTTQHCFAFCTYCFRHAQVRGDQDMFVQNDINQVHEYLKRHKEVTDVLITGGDAGYISFERLKEYVTPFIENPDLIHIKSLRLGSRALSFYPELILTNSWKRILDLFSNLSANGIQVVWMAHFSTPREILNPGTIAAIRRLRAHGVVIKSQSPIMKHISLFTDEHGSVDIERSAQNWIDLGNILAMLSIGFHSIYCARPTGEHHYFTAPLADVNKIFSRVYRSLASINRPSRYITMTSSAGKISLLGTTEVKGETLFALKFNEGRNMEWLDKVYLAKYDENENTIDKLKPFEPGRHFFEDELDQIEQNLGEVMNMNE